MSEVNFSDLPKDNYFYETIATFGVSIHGMLEVVNRGLVLNLKDRSKNDDEFNSNIDQIPTEYPDNVKENIRNFKTFTPMIFDFQYSKTNSNSSYYFDVDEFSKQIITADLENLCGQLTISIAGMVIISAFEKISSRNLKDSDVLQFFRHIRNAAAHNGKFHFTDSVLNKKNGDLKKFAKWKNFEIKSDLQGKNLFNSSKSSNDRYWNYGDLIDFLLDLENYYPELEQVN